VDRTLIPDRKHPPTAAFWITVALVAVLVGYPRSEQAATTRTTLLFEKQLRRTSGSAGIQRAPHPQRPRPPQTDREAAGFGHGVGGGHAVRIPRAGGGMNAGHGGQASSNVRTAALGQGRPLQSR